MGLSASKANLDETSELLAQDPDLQRANYPNPNGLTLLLPGPSPQTPNSQRRRLGHAVFGSRDAPRDRTILLMHGTPGTRFFFSEEQKEYIHRENSRILMVERPGYGLSTPQTGRTLLSTAADSLALLDELGYERVHVLGFSAGGPYALAFAMAYPERCRSLSVVSSLSPNVPGVTAGMTNMSKFGYALAGSIPFLLRLVVRAMGQDCLRNPFRASVDEFTEKENEIFKGSVDIRKTFAMCMLEQYSRGGGARAEADDYVLFARNWGFELSEIDQEIPIFVYGGGQDNKCTPAMFEVIVSGLPQKSLTKVFEEDQTHLFFYELFTGRLFRDIGLSVTET